MLLGRSGSSRPVTQCALEDGKAEQGREARAEQDSEPDLVELSGGVECQGFEEESSCHQYPPRDVEDQGFLDKRPYASRFDCRTLKA